jgi:hypothetical protein
MVAIHRSLLSQLSTGERSPEMIAPKLVPVWLSESDVRSLVQNARKANASLLSIVNGIDAQVEARRKSLNENLSDLDIKSRLVAVDTAVSTLKVTLKADSSKKRTDILRSLARMTEQAKAAVQFWDSSVQVVMRNTIASAKRATIQTNLSAAGAVELKTFAALAVAGKDLDMAAAVISKLHEMPASARPVSPRALADDLVGEVQREMHRALLEVDTILQEAILIDRMMETGRSGSTNIGAVKLALQRRNDALVGARVEDEADDA